MCRVVIDREKIHYIVRAYWENNHFSLWNQFITQGFKILLLSLHFFVIRSVFLLYMHELLRIVINRVFVSIQIVR